MKLYIGTYGKHWYSVDFSNNEFSNLERFEGQDHSCICVKDGIPYSISENTEAGPCYLTPVNGTDLFISSNFGDGSVELIRFSRKDGSDKPSDALNARGQNGIVPLQGLSAHLLQKIQFIGGGPILEYGRQLHSRVHQVLEFPMDNVFPNGSSRYFLATDFGADVIRVLEMACSSLKSEQSNIQTEKLCLSHQSQLDIRVPAGSGPRHMVFNIKEKMLYCLCELSNELLVYHFKTSHVELVQKFDTSQLGINSQNALNIKPAAGDLRMHPNGKWLYASRRLCNDGILVFRILAGGLLEFSSFRETEKHPRMMFIPSCKDTGSSNLLFVACKDGGVQVFPLHHSEGNVDIGPQKTSLYLPEGDSPVWVQPC